MNKTVALSSADLPRSFANAERIELLDEVLERREDLDEAELCDFSLIDLQYSASPE